MYLYNEHLRVFVFLCITVYACIIILQNNEKVSLISCSSGGLLVFLKKAYSGLNAALLV